MAAVRDLVMLMLDTYWWIIVLSAIFSWLLAFDVVNIHNRLVSRFASTLHQLTEPVLRHIRRFIPQIEGIDISPLILLFLIFFLRRLIFYYV